MALPLRTSLATLEPRDELRSAPELFSQEQLETHAVTLAATHRLARDQVRGRPLSHRLDQSARMLEDAYAFLTSAIPKDAAPVGSEDWLRDNHHVVLDQIR